VALPPPDQERQTRAVQAGDDDQGSRPVMSINERNVGVVGASVMALVACVAVTAVMLLVFAPAHPWQALHDWIEFVPLPGLVVFTTARSGLFEKRPWLLLLVGPLAFMIAALGLLLTHGIVFSPAILARKPKVREFAHAARY
jgi:hypothetical protein